MRSTSIASFVALALFVACGGAPSAPVEAATATAASVDPRSAPSVTPSAAATAPPAKGLPASCASNEGGVCVPDPDFAKRMCNGSFPDVGLALMAKESPFTRMYLKGDMDGWNADGGASARAKLFFDEEVLALRRRAAPKGGMVVGSGGGGYLVMRWDGNCYTVDDNEVTSKRPPAPKHSPIPWRFLGDKTKDALLADAKVTAAYQRRGKECKGATSGDVTKACEQADSALSAAVVAAVRGGLAVPTPDRLP